MKKSLWIGILLASTLVLVMPRAFNAFAEKTVALHSLLQKDKHWEDVLPEKEEINQIYELANGARVEVSGINGRVDIETTNGNTAEIHIMRSAKNRDDLQFRKITIEATANSLLIKGEHDKDQEGGRNREVRQQILLSVPRQIDLKASGVNGRVTVGEVDGPVTVSGVNGRVDVAQAVGYSRLSGINGKVFVKIVRLSDRGAQISGINGGVEIYFADDVNADLEVSGINGSVHNELPNMVVQGKMERNNFRARLGAGGAPIHVSGVNGKVSLRRAER